MLFSIVTPSYNQLDFLLSNVSSVQRQKGVGFEQLVFDPGSRDGSWQALEASPSLRIFYGRDSGQSDAISKGFALAKGEVICWLNSDDYLPSDLVLQTVEATLNARPDVDVVYGRANYVDTEGKFLAEGYVNSAPESLLESFEYQMGIVQPSVFMRRKIFESVGGPDPKLTYCLDHEYWIRIAKSGFRWFFIDEVLSHHRWWAHQKTSSARKANIEEIMQMSLSHFGYVHWRWFEVYANHVCTGADGVVNHVKCDDEVKKSSVIAETVQRIYTAPLLQSLKSSNEKQRIDTAAFISRYL